MMKCMKMRQVVCLSGCWNAAADGVVAEASLCLSQDMIWLHVAYCGGGRHCGWSHPRNTSWMQLLGLSWFGGPVGYFRPAVDLQPLGGRDSDAGILSTTVPPFPYTLSRSCMKFTAAGAINILLLSYLSAPAYNDKKKKVLKYKQCNHFAMQWQL
jgi:hypothetical protein